MKKLNILLILLLVAFCLHAQEKNAIGVTYIQGSKIFDTKGPYQGVGLSYNISTINNTASWVKILNVENISVNATLYDLGNITAGDRMAAYNTKFINKGYFGYDIALAGAIDIKLLDVSRFKLLFTPGIGLLYSTKDYTSTRGVNQMLGRHINAIGSAALKLEIPVTGNTRLNIGAGMAHVSNAGTAMPNNGLNRIETSIGISQGVSSSYGNPGPDAPEFKTGRNSLSVEMIAGYTSQVRAGFYQLQGVNLEVGNAYRNNSAPIPKASASLAYNHYFNDVFGVKAGTDLVYSSKLSPLGSTTSDTTTFLKTFQGDYTPVNSHFNVGLNAGVDLSLGRLVFSSTYGYYLGKYERYVYIKGGDQFQYRRPFYATFGCKYFITPKMAIVAKSYLHSFGGLGLNVSI